MTDESADGSSAAGRGPSDPFAPVYQPAEDSGLLAEAAASHARGVVLEVGTGSGWVAERVGASSAVDRVVGSDLNPHACRAARERGVAVVRGDLTSPFAADAFDTVLFNPPYLPAVDESDDEPTADEPDTSDPVSDDPTDGNDPVNDDLTDGNDAVSDDLTDGEETASDDVTSRDNAKESTNEAGKKAGLSSDETSVDWGKRALVGGETGRALIEPFLSDLGRVLRPDGVGLLLVSSLAGFGAVVEHAVACGFHADTVAEESFPFETLSVVRITHDD